ncbi:MAG: YbaB/EbfC family nucleoid-associated protein [Candidatus Dadabacteria bacterium]|nr:YbaB/EbfC family nucleoid-associated protein [Candidatus Dadabacteria bacterium]NIQ16673.1 YbaB/EbfC family nucleoid-associated protein [Candidatus Dadabacteria bacterium]
MKFGGNIKNLMKQAGKMKEQMEKLQAEVGEKTIEATSGGGMVTVTAKAKGEITGIKIEPELLIDNDMDMLQDLIIAAVNEALKRGQEMMQQEVSKMAGGLGIPPGLI